LSDDDRDPCQQLRKRIPETARDGGGQAATGSARARRQSCRVPPGVGDAMGGIHRRRRAWEQP